MTWQTEFRKPWFRDWYLGRLVVTSLRRLHDGNFLESLAFVVMPDHVHWLFRLESPSISIVAERAKSYSGFHVKQAIRNRGIEIPHPVWQDGFHDRGIRSDENLVDVARYIVMNPVRAGLARSVGDYPLWDAKWL